ncbi:hypothetical protein FOZ63_024860 [Perkinsus olseni]|uniref:Uncharacterized protein n=1 Tax=Perkinsus olseni TaxID=32597 RepID=A0A7J6RIV4_PEROL|nr:hypothetical protein FOZ63_024860 [Perkinsus olseni]
MSETTVSTGGVMTRAKVAVVEKEKAEQEEPQADVGGENDHKQEEVEKAETTEEGHEQAGKKDGPAIPKVADESEADSKKQDSAQPPVDGLTQYTGSQPQAAVLPPSAQPLMADMPVDKPSPSDIKRNLTPREARQLVELQYHEQLRQYQRWLTALAEAARERRRAEEGQHQQQEKGEQEPSSATSATQHPQQPAVSSATDKGDGGTAQDDEQAAKKRKMDGQANESPRQGNSEATNLPVGETSREPPSGG